MPGSPPSSSAPIDDVEVPAELAAARLAFDERRWADAYAGLSESAAAGDLANDDLERLADAAFWTGRMADAIRTRQHLFGSYKAAADRIGAARTALHLVSDHGNLLEPSLADGWLSRAIRLLEDEEPRAEHASIGRAAISRALDGGDLEEALRHAQDNLDLGHKLGDVDVEAVALQDRGRVLIALGRVEDGMADINEAMVAALSGEISPYPAAVVYCNATIACEDLTDYRAAGEFADAAARWCDSEDVTGFPGMCRVRKVEIIRLKGDWDSAEEEARKACAELADFSPAFAAEGHYQLGEIALRRGDLDTADAAFAESHRLGREPLPGLALLKLAQGNVEDGTSLLGRALSDSSRPSLMRARLLPAEAQLALNEGASARARQAAIELETISETFGTHMLRADAARARASAALLDGAMDEAIDSLRLSAMEWKATDAPWEHACVQALLGEALMATGETGTAELELAAAIDDFEQLGARGEVERARGLLEGSVAPRFTEARTERVGMSFMFTDIVGSTPLVEAIGDEAWTDVLRWHDRTIRELVAIHRGSVQDNAGDGFLLVFETADDALVCASETQARLSRHRRRSGFAPEVRIGIHTSEALRTADGLAGGGVHVAARVGSLAEGGEVIVTRATLDAAEGDHPHGPFHTVELKGVTRPVEVCALD